MHIHSWVLCIYVCSSVINSYNMVMIMNANNTNGIVFEPVTIVDIVLIIWLVLVYLE